MADNTEKGQELLDNAFASPTIRPIPTPVPGETGGRPGRGVSSAIDQLRTELASGGMPQLNRFQVNINPPEILGEGSIALRRMMIRTHSVSLPGNTLDTIPDNNIYGPNRNIVSGVQFADAVAMKFIMDERFDIKKYFQQWQKLMYSDATWNLKYYSEYIGTIDIFVLDRNFRPTAGYRVWEAYPSTIGSVEFTMGSNEFIKDFSVDFNFRYWSDIAEYGTQQPTNIHRRTRESERRKLIAQQNRNVISV